VKPATSRSTGAKATAKSTATKSTAAKSAPTKATDGALTNTPRKATAPAAAKSAATATARTAPRQGGTSKTAKTAASRSAGAGTVREEYAEIEAALTVRLAELRAEYDRAIVDLEDLQRDRVSDGAGDDQADTGTKTFEREQELSLVHGIQERVQQVEHALRRLGDGSYGECERCGNPIPTARLEAFPSVTLCVTCKQIEERR
jgi:DnaK suppressor protein